MADEPAPADAQSTLPDGPDAAAPELTLTDLIDEIERAAFERTLEGRHGPNPTRHEPASV